MVQTYVMSPSVLLFLTLRSFSGHSAVLRTLIDAGEIFALSYWKASNGEYWWHQTETKAISLQTLLHAKRKIFFFKKRKDLFYINKFQIRHEAVTSVLYY